MDDLVALVNPVYIQSTHSKIHCIWQEAVDTDLVQRPHGNLADVVGDELPGRALGVAGGEALSDPQVTYTYIEIGWLKCKALWF